MPLCRRTRERQSIRISSLMQLALVSLLVIAATQTGFAQNPQQFNIFKNYIVTGDYTVGGWVETGSSGGFATGTISIPDCKQYTAMTGKACQPGVAPANPIPLGADIVAAYLYWGTVEGSQTTFVGQQAYFNGYKIIGDVLGDPNAPTSWSAGGCTGSSTGSKTMRIYRADVRPYLPLDLRTTGNPATPAYPTYGAILANPSIQVRIADSGSNGNTQPNALGATLVLIWRDLSPLRPPLNAVVLYDGSYAPSNQVPTFNETIKGFYEPAAANLSAKITHIVANGQANKGETVSFTGGLGATSLTTLYKNTLGANSPPFPGIYGAWDNPTWDVTQYVKGGLVGSAFDTSELTSVSPASTNSGCVNWGAIVFSTTVQDKDGDGLLDAWEDPNIGGYYDVAHVDPNTGLAPFVALPGADSSKKDLFVEVDYLTLRDGDPKTGTILHSHLPKQAALDAIGDAFEANNINVHFDLPGGIYSSDQTPNRIISTGGGNEIPESSLMATDGSNLCGGGLCQFPNQPAISWKGDFDFIKFANFQSGREQSYHYALFGHSLGEPRSYWAAANTAVAGQFPTVPQLVSIVKSGSTATVMIKSPTLISSQGQLLQPQSKPLMLKPGDCTLNNPLPDCVTDANDANEGNLAPPPIWNRVTVSGSLTTYLLKPLTQLNPGPDPVPAAPPLNGTYTFPSASTGKADPNGMVTTTFQIQVSNPNVPDGTYQFSCSGQATNPPCIADPQLGVSYLGPTSTSGHGDFAGGDVAVTLGLWGADNAANCQPDPSKVLNAGQVYCDDQVGTLKVQTGTLMHELGHTLKLAHGGVYYPSTYPDPNNPNNIMTYNSVPTYELNCKPNYLSVMSYLFQVRGFVDGTVDGDPLQHHNQFDYSAQLLSPLNETTSPANAATYSQQFGNLINPLSESAGVGTDQFSQPAEHLTRWYSLPNAADSALLDQAKAHCDGTPFFAGEQSEVRVDGQVWPGGNFSAPFDWNNDLLVPPNAPAIAAPGIDLNHNGFPSSNGSLAGDAPFSGFDDWASIDLQQMNGRAGLFGFSEGGLGAAGGGGLGAAGGGGLGAAGGGGIDSNGAGGLGAAGGGGLGAAGGGGLGAAGGGGLGAAGGGGLGAAGGGGEQDTENANSTVDAPHGLNCNAQPFLTQNGVQYPACTGPSAPFLEKSKGVPLFWTSPDFGQIRSYTVWRAVGSFTTMQQVVTAFNSKLFQSVKTVNATCNANGTCTPPPTSTVDTSNLKSSTTYTYVVADSNKYGANSGASAPLVVFVKF